MRAAAIAVGLLAASQAISLAAEVGPAAMVAAPAGLYRPFYKEKAVGADESAATR